MSTWITIIRINEIVDLIFVKELFETNNIVYVEENGNQRHEYALSFFENFTKIHIRKEQFKEAKRLLIENDLKKYM